MLGSDFCARAIELNESASMKRNGLDLDEFMLCINFGFSLSYFLSD